MSISDPAIHCSTVYVYFVAIFVIVRVPRVHDHMVVGIILPVQSVLILTKVESSNPDHGEVYSI